MLVRRSMDHLEEAPAPGMVKGCSMQPGATTLGSISGKYRVAKPSKRGERPRVSPLASGPAMLQGQVRPQLNRTYNLTSLTLVRQSEGYLAPSRAGEPASLTFPQSINTPTSVLRTHRSIPNTTLYHPSLPYLYTCGVEKVIVRHSPATSSSSRLRSRSKWSFTPRIPRAEPASFLSSLFGAADPGEEPELLPGETEEARETRLRQEETAVLEYFDELIISESDFEGVWWDAKEGEVDGIVDEESSDDSDEGFGLDDEEDEERFEGAGESGTTRRILNSIAQAGEEDEGEGTSDTEGSQGSLTLSEQAEYQSLMDAWNERAGQGGSEDEAS